MKPYSQDLGEKFVKAVGRGLVKSEAGMHFRDQPLFGQALREAGTCSGHGLNQGRRGFSFRDVAIIMGEVASKRLNAH